MIGDRQRDVAKEGNLPPSLQDLRSASTTERRTNTQHSDLMWRAGCALCVLLYRGVMPDDADIHRLSLAFETPFEKTKDRLAKFSEELGARGQQYIYNHLFIILVGFNDALGEKLAPSSFNVAKDVFTHLCSFLTQNHNNRKPGGDTSRLDAGRCEPTTQDKPHSVTQLDTTQHRGYEAQKLPQFTCTFRCGARFKKKTWWRR